MVDYRMAPQPCPVCAYKVDAATSLFDEMPPDPGDYTFCMKCSAMLRWDPWMRLYEPRVEELRELDGETIKRLALTRRAICTMKAKQN